MAKNYSFTLELQDGKKINGVCFVEANERPLDKIKMFAQGLYGQRATVTSVE